MTNSRDRRRFEAILREPLTRQRLLLNGKIRAAQKGGDKAVPFTLDDFKAFVAGVQSVARGRMADPALAAEIANAITAVETGVAPTPPKFETPETQLVWGAALAYLLLNQQQMQSWQTPVAEGELRSSELWKQVVNNRRAHNELLSHAHHVREALRDKNTKYGWSDPGTGFTFQRQKNIINIDLMQSLIVGFEHARADVYREIGHSLLSVTYPKRMRDIYAEMQPLMRKMQQAQGKNGKKGKGPKLNDEEYKKLRLLSAEWQLRHMMYAAAEENVTSRFVANMGAQMLQDYSVSMNNTAVTFRGIGLTRLPADGQMSEDLRRYMNLCNTVQISFYQNNGMFDDTDAGWRGVGIDPALVRKLATLAGRPSDSKNDKDGISHADFIHLRELCRGPNGLENQQPKQHERLYGWGNLQNRIGRAAGERAAIVEQIWALYAEDLIRNILEHTKDQIEDDLEQAKKDQQDKQDGQEQDGDDNQDQDGQEQDGQEQDGQGQGQGQGKGKPQKGQKPKKDKNKDRNKPQGDQMDPDDLDDADSDDQDGQKGDKSKKKDKSDKGDKKDKGDKGDKSDQTGDEQDGDDSAADGDKQDGQDGDGEQKNGKDGELGADQKDTVPVEGAGDMPAPEAPFEDPSDELDPDADGNDADGEANEGDGNDADGSDADGDGDDGDSMTQEEIEQALQEMDEAEQGDEADGQDQDGDGDGQDADGKSGKSKKSKRGKGGKQAGHADGKKLGDLASQDWTQYQQRINELAPTIARVRKLFKDVQERQLQRKNVMSPKLETLPENGEVKDRFNVEAHRNLTLKKMTGQVTADDFKRFHPDEIKMTPTQIDIVLMIDGSGSMSSNKVGASGVSVLDCALQASAIMYEAAAGKDMNIKVYVGLWGDSNPPIIIHPGADRVKVGQAMQAARKGLHSGTDFAPAVKKVAQVIAEDRGKSGVLSGFTHVLILSDGDIFDQAKSVEMVNTMFTHSDKVTFDVAVMGRINSAMEQMARTIKGHKPFQQVGVALGSDPNTIPLNIVGLLLDKVRKCGSFTAVPTSQKRRAMQKAHNKMEPKR